LSAGKPGFYRDFFTMAGGKWGCGWG
jgi:hypothetical protein